MTKMVLKHDSLANSVGQRPTELPGEAFDVCNPFWWEDPANVPATQDWLGQLTAPLQREVLEAWLLWKRTCVEVTLLMRESWNAYEHFRKRCLWLSALVGRAAGMCLLDGSDLPDDSKYQGRYVILASDVRSHDVLFLRGCAAERGSRHLVMSNLLLCTAFRLPFAAMADSPATGHTGAAPNGGDAQVQPVDRHGHYTEGDEDSGPQSEAGGSDASEDVDEDDMIAEMEGDVAGDDVLNVAGDD